jgi:hypothetical protein
MTRPVGRHAHLVPKHTRYEALKTLWQNHPECRGLLAEAPETELWKPHEPWADVGVAGFALIAFGVVLGMVIILCSQPGWRVL